jgi:hypothetical protein
MPMISRQQQIELFIYNLGIQRAKNAYYGIQPPCADCTESAACPKCRKRASRAARRAQRRESK